MKKIILTILFCGVVIMGITGCGNEKNSVTINDLNEVNNKIVEYFSKDNIEYDNYSFNYVDEENKVVIVGLLNNSKEQQDNFRKEVVDSNLIKFVQASELIDEKTKVNIEKNINKIVNSSPNASSNPYDYIRENQEEYDWLLKYPKETFEYVMLDLIETNANNGLKSYIEVLLCKEINKNFEYEFESANDFLENYQEFLSKNYSAFNSYDKYALSLLK